MALVFVTFPMRLLLTAGGEQQSQQQQAAGPVAVPPPPALGGGVALAVKDAEIVVLRRKLEEGDKAMSRLKAVFKERITVFRCGARHTAGAFATVFAWHPMCHGYPCHERCV